MGLTRRARARSIEDEGYSSFLSEEYQRVLRTAALIVGDRETARDLTQEAFARLYRNWRKVSKYDRPEAWVRQVVVRLAVQHIRRKKVDILQLSHNQASVPGPDAGADDLQACVAALPAMQRAAVMLFYFEDRPSSEVAHILGCSEATVRVHLHRARKKLSTILREQGAEHAR